jgi:ABC transporter DrrB family efflux protein
MGTHALAAPAAPRPGGRLRWEIADALVIAKRYAIGMARTPEVLFFTTIQPIMFVLLFAYVFGGSIQAPGGDYAEYLMPGIFVQTVAFATAVTGSAVAMDMQRGVIDRFRSLPMARSAVLAGRTFSDVLLNSVSIVTLAACGLLIGWRVHTGLLAAAAGFALLLLFGYAMSWIGAYIGLSVKAPEVASQASLIWVIPLIFLSNLFVVVDTLPGWLQSLARWNPVSALITTVRGLFGNPDAQLLDSFPGRHPELMSLLWIGLILAVFVPLSVRKYRRTTR